MSTIMLKVLVPVLLLMALPVTEGFFGTNMYLLQDMMRMTQTKCGVVLDSVKLICFKSSPPACQTFRELEAFCQDIIGRCTQKFLNPKLCYPPFNGLNPYWKSITPNTFLFMRSFDRNDAAVYEYLCRLICVVSPTPLCDVLIWLVADARRLNGIPGQSFCIRPGVPSPPTAAPTTTTTTATPETTETTETAETTEMTTMSTMTTEAPCMFDCESKCDTEDRKEGPCPEGTKCCKKNTCSDFGVLC